MGMMDKDSNAYEPIRRYRRKKQPVALKAGMTVLLSVVVLVGAVIFVMSLTGTGLFRDSENKGNVPPVSTDSDTQSDSEGSDTLADTSGTDSSTPDTLPSGEISYKYIDKNTSEIGAGDLVLIDKDHIYKFPSMTLDTLYGNMSSSYQISNSSLSLKLSAINALNKMMDAFAAETGFTNAIVTSAYRSFDTQNGLYESYPNSAAMPGCSDYHTGVTFMLEGYIDDASGIFSLSNRQEGSWLKGNAAKYGFIFRFPSEKKSITGYNLPWQLRYVGVPHATYMLENDLCLEEYLALLAESYRYSDTHLTVNCADGMTYEIFYVEGADEGIVKLPVPSNRDYTVSGDNIGGFIVAVTVGETSVEA